MMHPSFRAPRRLYFDIDKAISMNTTTMDRRPRRRVRTWKIVLLVLLAGAVLEPVVMYRILKGERAQRAAARAPLELAVTDSAGN
jgi:hypothetical protein